MGRDKQQRNGAQQQLRPMRRAKREVTDPDEVRAIVERCRTVRLGLRDEQGPFVVPLSFGFDWNGYNVEGNCSCENGENGPETAETAEHSCNSPADECSSPTPVLTLWIHSAREGRKVDAFSADPLVAIEMDADCGTIEGDYSCRYSLAYESIMGTGTVRRAESTEEALHGLEKIMEHMAPGSPTSFSEEAVAQTAVFAIDVHELTAKRRM